MGDLCPIVGVKELLEHPQTRVFHIPALHNLSDIGEKNKGNDQLQEVLLLVLLSNPWLDW